MFFEQFIYENFFPPAILKVVVKNQAIKKKTPSVKPARKPFLAPILSLRELCKDFKNQGFCRPEVYHQV